MTSLDARSARDSIGSYRKMRFFKRLNIQPDPPAVAPRGQGGTGLPGSGRDPFHGAYEHEMIDMSKSAPT